MVTTNFRIWLRNNIDWSVQIFSRTLYKETNSHFKPFLTESDFHTEHTLSKTTKLLPLIT